MPFSINRIIDFILEGLFIGFGMSLLIFFLISKIKAFHLKSFYQEFRFYAIKIIKVTGIIYGVYFVYLWTINFTRLLEFLKGEEMFYTLFFSIRSILMIIISQLVWKERIRNHRFKVATMAVALFMLGLCSNYVIERYIIFTTQYIHADFMPVQSYDGFSLNEMLALTLTSFFIERFVLFSATVFIVLAISKSFRKA
ncbi:hypothetical protein ACU8DI_06255 [Psychroserpens sp. BH13MA-6]